MRARTAIIVAARKAGHRDPEIATFYADLCKRFESIPGVSGATLSRFSSRNAGVLRAAAGGTHSLLFESSMPNRVAFSSFDYNHFMTWRAWSAEHSRLGSSPRHAAE
jgi:hypothetical protein